MRLQILLEKIPNVVYLFSGLILLFSFVSPNFFSIANLSNLILQGSVLLIVSLGLTLVMLSNGIDLSVGSLMSLCGMVAGISLSKGLGLIPALLSWNSDRPRLRPASLDSLSHGWGFPLSSRPLE